MFFSSQTIFLLETRIKIILIRRKRLLILGVIYQTKTFFVKGKLSSLGSHPSIFSGLASNF